MSFRLSPWLRRVLPALLVCQALCAPPAQAQHASAAGEDPKTEERPFQAGDFKWPLLIENLYGGTLQASVNTDESVFILYYLKSMNEVFGDSEMKVFLASKCFTDIYDAEMEARLQSMFWLKVVPKAMSDLGAIVTDKNTSVSNAMAVRYPMLSGITKDLSREVSAGSFDRLFILSSLPSILKNKAHQDAITLFTTYGCSSPVTTRIYKNAVTFVKSRSSTVE